jgi:hypothetical protein
LQWEISERGFFRNAEVGQGLKKEWLWFRRALGSYRIRSGVKP